jgi:polyhydroxybutyrate depolymerase
MVVGSAVSSAAQSTFNFTWGGLTRTYKLYLPTGYNGTQRLPLLLSLHPGFSNADNHANTAKWQNIGDTAGFITLYPNGTSQVPGSTSYSWNAYNLTTGPQADDAGFLATLLDSTIRNHSIDTCRIYLSGFSNGAWMDWRMACDFTSRFAAVGPVSGSWKYGTDGLCNHGGCNGSTIPGTNPPSQEASINCTPSREVPYMYYRGSAEASLTDRAITDPAGEEFWRVWNGCNALPITDTVYSEGDKIIRERYTACAPGAETIIMNVMGNSHFWHASATAQLWAFFRRQSKCSTAGIPGATSARSAALIYPNPATNFVSLTSSSAVSLYDLQGRPLMAARLTVGELLDIGSLAPGVYLVRIESAAGHRWERLIKN